MLSYSGRGNLSWRITSIRLACNCVCERLSQLMVDVGEREREKAHPTVGGTRPMQVDLLWVRKPAQQWKARLTTHTARMLAQLACSRELLSQQAEFLYGFCLSSCPHFPLWRTMTWVCKLKSFFPKLLSAIEFVVAVLIYRRRRVKLEQCMCICLSFHFFINLSPSVSQTVIKVMKKTKTSRKALLVRRIDLGSEN